VGLPAILLVHAATLLAGWTLACAGPASIAADRHAEPRIAEADAALDRASPRPGDGLRYGAEPLVPPTPVEQDATAAAVARLTLGGASPARSAALSLAARELAGLAARGDPDPLSRRRVREAVWRAAAPDAAPSAHLVSGPRQRVVEALLAVLQPDPATHLGVGAAEHAGIVHLAVITSARRARIAPFPAAVPPGADPVLSGDLTAPLSGARVVVTLPSGEVRQAGGGDGRRFRVRPPLEAPGRYVIEVVGTGPRGPQVAALLAVTVGAPGAEPETVVTSAAAAAAEPRPEPRGDEGAESRLLGEINRLRRRHRLAPLTASPALAAVARRHSEAMLAQGLLAHVLPGGGDLADRLHAARIPYRRALENVATGRAARDAHEAVEESPAHRANLLSPDVVQLGVGLARGALAGGDPVVYLTEILVAPSDPGEDDRRSPEERVRVALWAERQRLGRAPLTSDPRLEALASEAVAVLQRDGELTPQPFADRALALGRSVAAADAFVVGSPAEAARSAHLHDARFSRVGVAVTQGDSPRWGAGRLFIAIVYADAPPDR